MFTSIAGRAVVVTGGTRGIGKGIASVFARNGAKVLITGRDAEAARAAAEELQAQAAAALEPGEVSFVLADVASREDCRRVAAIAQERLGGVDVLCANAGIFPDASLEDLTEDDLDQVFGTNLKGTILSVQACLPALAASGRGRVILTSSITGPITGFPGWTHYGASKAGQLGFMRTAAIELAPKGITVNAVLPGNIVTEGLAEHGRGLRGRDDRRDPDAPAGHGGRDRLRRPVPGHGRGRLHHRPDDRRGRRPGAARIARGHGGDRDGSCMTEVPSPRTPEEVRRALAEQIGSGRLRPGQRLGAERALAAEFGVSRATLRQALAVLEEGGVVRRVPGRGGGTFVAKGKIERDLSRIVGVPALLRSQGVVAGTRVLSARGWPRRTTSPRRRCAPGPASWSSTWCGSGSRTAARSPWSTPGSRPGAFPGCSSCRSGVRSTSCSRSTSAPSPPMRWSGSRWSSPRRTRRPSSTSSRARR